jgi:NAD(P)-dependent dehydrogenase (short-subunit alcohol dehydrogenase family)
MRVKLKPLSEQVMVITGASSGIGLATAELAASRGARVVLSSRDENDLRAAGERIKADGGQVTWFAADVADPEAMRGLAQLALAEFDAIDSWVNNAGVSIVGRIEDVSLQDARRLFETNYWGVVHGSLAALPHLGGGGALINVGSILSDTGYPLQGHYAASKHAVKGFTDSLRLEVEQSGRPISVTVIQPAAIDTPYPEHAKSYLGVEPKHLPPVYAPEVVAKTILHCAEHPERNVLVGGGAKLFELTEQVTPRLGDRLKEAVFFSGQHTDVPDQDTDTLHAPRPGDARVRGTYPGRVFEHSTYTAARLSRKRTLLGLAVIGAGLVLAARRE